MKRIGFNAEECRLGLEGYSAELEELMELVQEPHLMTPKSIEQAKSQLASLKSCLETDHKLRDTEKGRAQMTEVEAAIYAPAVHQALADFSISVGSRPNKAWYSELYGMQITISNALSSLKAWIS